MARKRVWEARELGSSTGDRMIQFKDTSFRRAAAWAALALRVPIGRVVLRQVA